jgi:hypothetical protein
MGDGASGHSWRHFANIVIGDDGYYAVSLIGDALQ